MKTIAYSLFIILAFVCAYSFLYFTSPKLQRYKVKSIIPISFVCSIFGALLYTVIVTAIQGHVQFGLSSLGAAIGYFISVLVYQKYQIVKDKKLLKRCALTLPLLYGISKTGCLIKGCCRGEFLGIKIQIIEIILFLMIFLFCLYIDTAAPITLFIASIAKIFIEFFRAGVSIPSPNQITAAIIAISTVIVYVIRIYNSKTKDVAKCQPKH